MFQDKNARMFQEQSPDKSAPMFQDRNAEMFQDSSARMYQDRWQSRTADRSQDSSARMCPVRSQERNAPMCQDSSARMSPDKSVEMSQDSSVNKFHSRCVTQHSQLMESKETNSTIKIHSPENPYNNIFMLNIETPSQVF